MFSRFSFPTTWVATATLLGWFAAAAPFAIAQDGNETFSDATVLPPGTRSLDDLFDFVGDAPDLTLGVFDDDFLIDFDDDNSRLGDGFAPGLEGVPVNAGGGIDFRISGHPDFDFDGLEDGGFDPHFAFGAYEVEIEVFDSQGVFLAPLFFSGFLENGVVDSFFDTDPAWDGGFYDIDVNNLLDPNDVDFFRFTGLVPGNDFVAATQERTTAQGFLPDTLLGWFDDNGDLIATNDDTELVGGLSGLRGVVPPSGQVVIAVSGFPDFNFEGLHSIVSDYRLGFASGLDLLPGDLNADLVIDFLDEMIWRFGYGETGATQAADANGDGLVNAADYTVWRDALDAAGSNVPEPTGWLAAGICLAVANHRVVTRSRLR